MSDNPMQDLRNALLRTATRRTHPWWRRRPIWLATFAVLLIAAPATAGIGGLWSPDVKPAAPMVTTTAPATPSAASCLTNPFSGRRTTTATPPPDVIGALGILRTPATAADRAGQPVTRSAAFRGVSRDHVRLLGTDADGKRQWIAPALRVIEARPATRECPARPASRTWSLVTFSEDGGGGSTDAATLKRQGATGSTGSTDRESIVTGIAPDGVAEVSVSYDGTAARTWPVTRNFYSYRVALPAERAVSPDITWKNSSGGTIKTIRSP